MAKEKSLTDQQREFLAHMRTNFLKDRNGLKLQQQAAFSGLGDNDATLLHSIVEHINDNARVAARQLLAGTGGDIAANSQLFVRELMDTGLFGKDRAAAARFYIVTAQLAAGDLITKESPHREFMPLPPR